MNENEMITSIWGAISRREMLRRLAISGFAVGLGGSGLTSSVFGQDDVKSPTRAVAGTPFREITRFQSVQDDLLDVTKLQRDGTPKPRTRDTSWFDKPNNAVGVSLLQFTNTPVSPLNTCAQAACATVLNFHKKAPPGLIGDGITNEIYRTHPPNHGENGTSFFFAAKILGDYGLKTWTGTSNQMPEATMIEKLKTSIAQGQPPIVLLDMQVPMKQSGGGTMGHFVTVFAHTDTHVFMTNWNYKKVGGWPNDWSTFLRAWSLPEGKNHHMMLLGWA